jgi:hypothetical protein
MLMTPPPATRAPPLRGIREGEEDETHAISESEHREAQQHGAGAGTDQQDGQSDR